MRHIYYRMKSDILIISDVLLEPPSEPMAFRTVTMLCHYDLEMDILLHTTQEMKDLYYNWMKPRGLMDYVNYILNEFEFESGVRIDVVKFYPDTVVVKAIRLENQLSVLGRVKSLSGK
jgi:hypothetical protein